MSVSGALSFGGAGAAPNLRVRERVAAAGLSLSEFEQHVHARGRDAGALVSYLTPRVPDATLGLFVSAPRRWGTGGRACALLLREF